MSSLLNRLLVTEEYVIEKTPNNVIKLAEEKSGFKRNCHRILQERDVDLNSKNISSYTNNGHTFFSMHGNGFFSPNDSARFDIAAAC